MFARGSSLGILLVGLAGCGMEYIDGGYTCANPEKDHIGSDGLPDPCHYLDAPDADDGLPCAAGEFVHWRVTWEPPTLLWFGPPDQVPECPLGPTTISYEGRTDLVAPSTCETCTCEPPTGSCALPSTLTVSTSVCGTPGATTSFDAPIPWDGQCDSTNQVPSGAAHSLSVAPLTLKEDACVPGPSTASKVAPLHWNTFARGCDAALPLGPIQRSICLPDDPLPPGFSLCIYQSGVNDCPNDEPGNIFTEQHIFYQGVTDGRQCSACTCGEPAGSVCTATIAIYKGADLTCSGATVTQTTISSVSSTCIDIQLPGQALGSKAAGPPAYLPGTCPAMGGEPSGSAVKTTPATLCCRP